MLKQLVLALRSHLMFGPEMCERFPVVLYVSVLYVRWHSVSSWGKNELFFYDKVKKKGWRINFDFRNHSSIRLFFYIFQQTQWKRPKPATCRFVSQYFQTSRLHPWPLSPQLSGPQATSLFVGRFGFKKRPRTAVFNKSFFNIGKYCNADWLLALKSVFTAVGLLV